MTPQDVAEWMLKELRRDKFLYQDVAASEITTRFGEDFGYINDNGNQAIAKSVLAAFRALTGETVVWERGERVWRLRADYDPQGKRQAD